MPDFLDEKRSEIDDRLAELQPLVEEYGRLQAASAALAEVAGASGSHAAQGVLSSAPAPAQSADAGVSSSPRQLSGTPDTPGSPVVTPGVAPLRRGPGRPRGGGSIGAGAADDGRGEVDVVSNGGDTGTGEAAVAEVPAPAAGESSESRPGAMASPSSGPRRAGRPKGSGQRAAEALRIVREQPGVTIPELADRMGIKQNYLYRVLPELVQEGKVVKQGRGWHPRAA